MVKTTYNIIHYCEANEAPHNLQINHIIHYSEANDTSQPTNKSYHTLL